MPLELKFLIKNACWTSLKNVLLSLKVHMKIGPESPGDLRQFNSSSLQKQT